MDSLDCFLDLIAMDDSELECLSQRKLAVRWKGSRRAVSALLWRMEKANLISVSALNGKTSIKLRTTFYEGQHVDSKGTYENGEVEKRTTQRTTFEGSETVTDKDVTTSDLTKSAPLTPTSYSTNTNTNSNSNREVEQSKSGARARFIKPTIVQLSEHAESIGFDAFDAQEFLDHYEKYKWRFSRAKGAAMTSWKRTMGDWKRRSDKWDNKQGNQEVISFE